jgi:hypothetical protein
MKFWHKLFAQAYAISLKWIFACIYKTKVVILSASVLTHFYFPIILTDCILVISVNFSILQIKYKIL